MSYVKINGDNTKYYVSLMPFKTQHGIKAIRFVGDNIPETDKGFKLYDDNDELVSDLSEYIYLYHSNEYSVEQDNIELPTWTNEPIKPSAIDRLNSRISQVSSQVSAITPYEETKKAYYNEIEKVFYNVPIGNITIFFDNYTGEYEVKRVSDRLTITFPNRLTDATNITVMVNK